MSNIQHCSVNELKQILSEKELTLLDVRDPNSFSESHIENAINLDKNNLDSFIVNSDKSKPVCVYCYRGISCIAVANELSAQGFEQVYSLDGGYEAWHNALKG